MEFKARIKTRKDLEKEYSTRKAQYKNGEPLTDSLKKITSQNKI